MTDYSVSVSVRSMGFYEPVESKLKSCGFGLDKIDSVFGFLERTKLYGGRIFSEKSREIDTHDLEFLAANGISLRIPLQNLMVTDALYEEERWFLDKYYAKSNSLIVASDKFARTLRRDYPDYELECSVVRQVDSLSKFMSALDLYDTIVLDPRAVEIGGLHKKIPIEYRHRVRLFVNSGCLFTCGKRSCYSSISARNIGLKDDKIPVCSAQQGVPRLETDQVRSKITGLYEFDVESYIDLGYSKFKVLPRNNQTLIARSR